MSSHGGAVAAALPYLGSIFPGCHAQTDSASAGNSSAPSTDMSRADANWQGRRGPYPGCSQDRSES
jgi:hypothetical protein